MKNTTSPVSSKRAFRVLYSNVASVLNKLDELSSYAFEINPDFIAICESCGHADLNDAFFSIPGYEVVCRNDRKDTTLGIGGGLLIYARNDMVGRISEYTTPELDNFTQSSAIKVRLEGNSEVTLVLFYRPHHIYKDKEKQPGLTAANNEKLCDLLHILPKPYVMVGDLNYSNIDWVTLSSDSAGADFLMATEENFLSQHIDFATHNSGTQPDVVLSSNPDSVLDVTELCTSAAVITR